ncbi:MAG: exodeoxyribonuclease VII small subunit, partial [Spirochaetes bacterium]|nr:exodeoxyribonuclease VII small subunit [Spirochaetota bacterium]
MEEKKKKTDKLTFEEALSDLEKIAERLEDGQLGLDDSIAAFEKGVNLVKFCREKLEEADRNFEIIQKGEDDKDGSNGKILIYKLLNIVYFLFVLFVIF